MHIHGRYILWSSMSSTLFCPCGMHHACLQLQKMVQLQYITVYAIQLYVILLLAATPCMHTDCVATYVALYTSQSIPLYNTVAVVIQHDCSQQCILSNYVLQCNVSSACIVQLYLLCFMHKYCTLFHVHIHGDIFIDVAVRTTRSVWLQGTIVYSAVCWVGMESHFNLRVICHVVLSSIVTFRWTLFP